MKVKYDKVQFDAAVGHVWAHNNLASSRTREECEATLMHLIKDGIKRPTTYISSGGFTVIFATESDGLWVEISVDPTFKDGNYITMEV